MGSLPLLLLLAVLWYLFVWQKGKLVERRNDLLQAPRRVEEDLRRALEGEHA